MKFGNLKDILKFGGEKNPAQIPNTRNLKCERSGPKGSRAESPNTWSSCSSPGSRRRLGAWPAWLAWASDCRLHWKRSLGGFFRKLQLNEGAKARGPFFRQPTNPTFFPSTCRKMFLLFFIVFCNRRTSGNFLGFLLMPTNCYRIFAGEQPMKRIFKKFSEYIKLTWKISL